MPDINYAAVIADLEDKGNAMLEAAAALRKMMVPAVEPRLMAPKPVKRPYAVKPANKDGEIKPISHAIREAINGQRTAIQIADVVEAQYPDRSRSMTRDNVSTQLSQWQRENRVRKDSEGRIYHVPGAAFKLE